MLTRAHPQKKALKLGQVFGMPKARYCVMPIVIKGQGKHLKYVWTPEDLAVYHELEEKDLVTVKSLWLNVLDKEVTLWHGFGVLDQARID